MASGNWETDGNALVSAEEFCWVMTVTRGPPPPPPTSVGAGKEATAAVSIGLALGGGPGSQALHRTTTASKSAAQQRG